MVKILMDPGGMIDTINVGNHLTLLQASVLQLGFEGRGELGRALLRCRVRMRASFHALSNNEILKVV
ncbi:MAG: hypothetical protein JAY66_15030, partial [Candidatus Thiodiazotropha taylori]|nr:hypothetical protein [Candidatus Thiodiazotropha taylori]